MYKVKYLVTLSSIISMASLPVDAHTGVNTVNGLLDGLVHPFRHSAPLGHLIDIQSYIFLLNSNIIFN